MKVGQQFHRASVRRHKIRRIASAHSRTTLFACFFVPTKRIDLRFETIVFDDFDSIADLLNGFCKVDDVDTIALFENETFHLRIPTVLLVPKMGTSF